VPVAWRPATLEALGWLVRWRHLAADHGPQLTACLDTSTQQRLQGFGLWSTDVLVGLFAAVLAPDLPFGLLLAAGCTALAYALRLAVRFLRYSPRTSRLHAPLARLLDVGWPGILLGLLVYTLVAVMLAAGVQTATGHVAPVIAIVGIGPGALLLWLAWRMVGLVEVAIAGLSGWRGAVDRLEFARMVKRRDALYPAAPPEQPYGPRLSWRERLRAIGEARRLQERELLQGTRPPVPRVTLNLGSGGRPSWGRLAWIAFWLLFAGARLAHLFGPSN
jgi:hypothetical protein